MPWTDDPVADFEAFDRKLAEELKKFPTCELCGEAILQEMAFNKDGFWICDKCFEDNKRMVNE